MMRQRQGHRQVQFKDLKTGFPSSLILLNHGTKVGGSSKFKTF
jgi:hypothetical protein